MADTKITALTALTAADPSTDVLPIVDTSDTTMAASGTTKKISINNILGASGTATLASATVTGNLTVDTSTLKVDSANDRVGIGTASPAFTLDVQATVAGAVYGSVANNDTGGSGSARFRVFNSGDVSDGFAIINNYGAAGQINLLNYKASSLALWTNSVERFTISSTGVATWSNVGGGSGTAMTLNSTGLGVGASPTQKLHVKGVVNFEQVSGGTNGWQVYTYTDGTYRMNYNGAGADELIIDTSGNVGIGVAPSAWNSSASALEFKNGIALYSFGSGTNGNFITNGFYNSGGSFIYKTSNTATRYQQFDGSHLWYTAPSGTAGDPITFTERLRLKETGQLRFVPLASDPSGAEAGDVYYNSTSNKLKCYNGTTWNDLF